MSQGTGLLEELAPERRLALAYAPAASRGAMLGLLVLDARLGGIVLRAREPMLAQVRLAWWRDRLAEPAEAWPKGEPLLELLQQWPADAAVLGALVDGWEGLLAAEGLPDAALLTLADARGAAFAALGQGGQAPAAGRMGREWGMAELACHLPDPAMREAAARLARASLSRPVRLPRLLRPLAVLHAIAVRGLRKADNADKVSLMAVLAGIRVGLSGF